MNFSLNEMEATAKRAARGAGYGWGQAEEASKATRWLCQQGLDGAGTLAQFLQLELAKSPMTHHPGNIEGPWQAEHTLCPLITGPLMSDVAHKLMANPIEMRNVASPALLLPFACNAARTLQTVVTVQINDIQAVTDGTHLMAPDRFPTTAEKVVVSLGGELSAPRKKYTRAHPAKQDWQLLNRLAHLTYAPATEESRRLGAGAGSLDND